MLLQYKRQEKKMEEKEEEEKPEKKNQKTNKIKAMLVDCMAWALAITYSTQIE